MLPSIFGESLFDDMFDEAFAPFFGGHNPLYGKRARNLMKADVRETDGAYELDIDLPGFKKEEVTLKLDQDYLTIEAAKGLDKDDKDKEGRYIRRERYSGACSSSFYVGDQITEKDISAKFEDGILKIRLPKPAQQIEQQPNRILIE